MAGRGHVPKFDGKSGGNFTETFDSAQSSGRRGESGALKAEVARNESQPTRRRPTPASGRRPARRAAPVSVGGMDSDSHIPTFGTWNVDQNYTGIFQAASKAKKGEAGGPALQPVSGGKSSGGSGDLYKPHQLKKRSSSWCCFGG